MEGIKEIRHRLDALTTDTIKEYSLADCQELKAQLRKLKQDVLASIAGLRTGIQERASAATKSRRSLRETWRQREDGAKKLLADVQERVIGLVDGKHGDALEAWSRINQEIDARLAKLAKVESRLSRVTSDGAVTLRTEPKPSQTEDAENEDLYAAAGAMARPQETEAKAEEPDNDNLYAAVGAAVRKGQPRDAYCPHCGQGLDPEDRFCRRCGHRMS